jgi:hypothetical protein
LFVILNSLRFGHRINRAFKKSQKAGVINCLLAAELMRPTGSSSGWAAPAD